MADVDGDFLAFAGLHLVNVSDGNADTGEDVCRRLADPEARGKDGILPGNRYLAVLGQAAAADAHDLFESQVHDSSQNRISPACQ